MTTARPNLVITFSSSVLFRDLASVECRHFLKWLTQVARVLYKRSRHPSIYTAHADQATASYVGGTFLADQRPPTLVYSVSKHREKVISTNSFIARRCNNCAMGRSLRHIRISVMGYFRYSVMGFDCKHQLLLRGWWQLFLYEWNPLT